MSRINKTQTAHLRRQIIDVLHACCRSSVADLERDAMRKIARHKSFVVLSHVDVDPDLTNTIVLAKAVVRDRNIYDKPWMSVTLRDCNEGIIMVSDIGNDKHHRLIRPDNVAAQVVMFLAECRIAMTDAMMATISDASPLTEPSRFFIDWIVQQANPRNYSIETTRYWDDCLGERNDPVYNVTLHMPSLTHSRMKSTVHTGTLSTNTDRYVIYNVSSISKHARDVLDINKYVDHPGNVDDVLDHYWVGRHMIISVDKFAVENVVVSSDEFAIGGAAALLVLAVCLGIGKVLDVLGLHADSAPVATALVAATGGASIAAAIIAIIVRRVVVRGEIERRNATFDDIKDQTYDRPETTPHVTNDDSVDTQIQALINAREQVASHLDSSQGIALATTDPETGKTPAHVIDQSLDEIDKCLRILNERRDQRAAREIITTVRQEVASIEPLLRDSELDLDN